MSWLVFVVGIAVLYTSTGVDPATESHATPSDIKEAVGVVLMWMASLDIARRK